MSQLRRLQHVQTQGEHDITVTVCEPEENESVPMMVQKQSLPQPGPPASVSLKTNV